MNDKTINDGGLVFPISTKTLNTGMSLRDYFAGQALVSAINQTYDYEDGNSELFFARMRLVARDCYSIADAMLDRRGKS